MAQVPGLLCKLSLFDLQIDPGCPSWKDTWVWFVLHGVLYLGKPQEQPETRLFELGLKVRCQCYIYGILNNDNRFRPEKTLQRVGNLILSLTSCHVTYSLSLSFLICRG